MYALLRKPTMSALEYMEHPEFHGSDCRCRRYMLASASDWAFTVEGGTKENLLHFTTIEPSMAVCVKRSERKSRRSGRCRTREGEKEEKEEKKTTKYERSSNTKNGRPLL